MKKVTNITFAVYKKTLSPILVHTFGHACRFTPTCSEYAKKSFEKYGFFKGALFSLKRLLKCNPFSPIAFDPVP